MQHCYESQRFGCTLTLVHCYMDCCKMLPHLHYQRNSFHLTTSHGWI